MFATIYKTSTANQKRFHSQQKYLRKQTMVSTSIQNFPNSQKYHQHEGQNVIKLSLPNNMNILVNGKIISERISPLKIKFTTNGFVKAGWTKKLPTIRESMTRQCFTEQEQLLEESDNHMDAIIKLRKIFNERNRGRRSSYEKQLTKSHTMLCQNRKQLSKIMSIRTPNIYALKGMKRLDKYSKAFAKRSSQCQSIPSAKTPASHQMSKASNLSLQKSQDMFVSFGIDAWETE